MFKRYLLIFVVLLQFGCAFRTVSLPADVIYINEDLKGVIGRYYAAVEYNNELLVEVMLYGMQDKFLQENKGWITLAFRRHAYKQLAGGYTFDANAVKLDIGELTIRKISPESRGGELRLTELLNSNPDAVVFVEYAVSVDRQQLFEGKKLVKRPFIVNTGERIPVQGKDMKVANRPVLLDKQTLDSPLMVIGTLTIAGIEKNKGSIEPINVGISDERLRLRLFRGRTSWAMNESEKSDL